MMPVRSVFVIVMGLVACSVSAQSVSNDHKRWIERDVAALVTRDEAQLFHRLPSEADRDTFQQIFWLRRDPDLKTPENELRTAYEERVAIADDQIHARMGPGSLTDMGQILYRTAEQTDEPGGVPGRAFQFSSVKLEPIGNDVFATSDSLGLFFYVYGAEGQDVTARYVFYQGAAEKAQTRPQPLIAAEGIALGSDEIPLASFAPGDYRVVIHVEDESSGNNLQSSVRFTLAP